VRDDERSLEFVAFARAHRTDLVRTATLLCAGDEAFAEDVVQTTLTRLYLSWSRVRRADSPLAYARRSLTHAFIDETRRAHRRRETTMADPAEALATEPTDGGTDHELRAVVLRALASLGPRQRAVVVLRHWHDLDVAETARILGCSTGTVKSQNARALAHLREVLGAADHQLILEMS
jgi:RNA polymerase sigma-70 factor (sigma-E family)